MYLTVRFDSVEILGIRVGAGTGKFDPGTEDEA